MRSAVSLDEWGDFPRKHVEAEFHKVLTFEDEIEARIEVERLGRTSITYAWTISKDGEECIVGRHTVVHVDKDGRPAAAARPRARSAVSLAAVGDIDGRVVVGAEDSRRE